MTALEDLSRSLAARIRAERIELRLTQAQLAQRAGVTVETVARLERVLRGRTSANGNPSLDTLVRLATALDVTVSWLLWEPSTHNKKEGDHVSKRTTGMRDGNTRAGAPGTRRVSQGDGRPRKADRAVSAGCVSRPLRHRGH